MDEAVLDEYEMKAKLHGKEFKRPPKALKIKEEDKEIFDKQARDLQKRLRRKYYENKFKEKLNG